jgi:hypothetical protein
VTEQNWMELESVQKHLARAAKWAAAEARHRVEKGAPDAVLYDEPAVESPIEAIYKIWWYAVSLLHADGAGRLFGLDSQREVTANERQYRLDFIVQYKDPDLLFAAHNLDIPTWAIAVEVDGHDFHERTKDQVADRNQRDRDLAQAGWLVFHYSGTELYRDPVRCITEVMDAAQTKHIELGIAVARARRERGGE